jgi:hypothetical protein
MATTPNTPVIVHHERGSEPGIEIIRTAPTVGEVSVLVEFADRTQCWFPARKVDAQTPAREAALAGMTFDPEVARAISDRWAR